MSKSQIYKFCDEADTELQNHCPLETWAIIEEKKMKKRIFNKAF